MPKTFITLGVIFLAAVAEISLSPNLFFGRVVPDVVLVLIIIWATRRRFQLFWPWALSAGLILDIISLGRVGLNALSFVIVSFGVNFISKRFFVARRGQAFMWMALLLVLGTTVDYVVISGLSDLAIRSLAVFNWHVWFFKILNNLIFLVVIYWPVASSRTVFPMEEERLLVR